MAGGRVVIVGASLAGLRAAEALRAEGFAGRLTIVGDEPDALYDRPPLSKSVLAGRLPVERTALPQLGKVEAEWLLGVPAAGLDLAGRKVQLDDGRQVGFDRLLIATGTRARRWPDPEAAALDGVVSLRTRDDAARLRARLAAGPGRVLIIGCGFIGSEVASACRELGLAVTVVERSRAPLAGALGLAAGTVVGRLQCQHGVDLRCGVTVMELEGDADRRLRRVWLSDGDVLDADVAVIALGAARNTEWLRGAGLAADARGVVCDAFCRAFDADAAVTDDIFVAGDVARWPHPLYDGQLLAVEHWGNAVEQAATAAHNMVCAPSQRRHHKPLPAFWSNQFGWNLKLVGLPSVADEITLTQGSVAGNRFVAVYGRQGRTVAAVAVNAPRWLPAYKALIEAAAPFPPYLHAADAPASPRAIPAGRPPPGHPTHSACAEATGPGPGAPETVTREPALADPRVPPGPPPLEHRPAAALERPGEDRL
jgi:3-phenylpropionate/trans-cinnamate dioxygenase ferredoxin reductase component